MKFTATFILAVTAYLQSSSAWIIPSIDLFKELQNPIKLSTPVDQLQLVETEALQELITLEQLNSSAIELFEISKKSIGKYGHPTRVIGSPGHWATIDWILSHLKEWNHYYTFYTQDFKALDGKIFDSSLIINDEKLEAKPFSLTPSADIYGTNVFIVKNMGCDAADYKGIGENWNSIALVKRGACSFGKKVTVAGKAGAKAVLIYDENAEDAISGTLGKPFKYKVGTFSIKRSDALALIKKVEEHEPIKISLFIDAYVGYIKTKNIIAETIGGDHDNVVSLGAHSDSVEAGPGINDDGSGTISLLTVARQLTKFKVKNAVRFAWWAAEEEGLLGSNYYTKNLTPEENAKIRLFMDYDMMASPNYEYQVYNGSNEVNPEGSAEIKDLYIDFYESKGLKWKLTPFDGRSDYVGFIENGIPSGGIAAGAEGLNSQNGKVLDKCYHLLCDNLTNIDWDAFAINTKLIAHSVATYANSLEGFPKREIKDKNVEVELANIFEYRGNNLVI